MKRGLIVLWVAACTSEGVLDLPHEPPVDDPARVLLTEGAARMESDDVYGGLDCMTRALEDAETDGLRVEALRWLAHGHTRVGDPMAAQADLLRALELVPDDPWTCYALGMARHTMGEYDAAIDDYTRAIQLDPGHVKAWLWRGSTRRLMGDPAAGAEDCSRALELLEGADPDAFDAWGGDRIELLREVLEERARAFDVFEEHERAAQDRERARGLQ